MGHADAPTVTLGLPVYNGDRFLETALASLRGQSFEDFEIVISDNGSTDGTVALCERHAAEDSRIRLHRNDENRGAAWNYNHVFDLGRGRYFKWAAADDVCEPDYLDRCVRVLEGSPEVVLAYPRTRIIDADGADQGLYDDGMHLVDPSPARRFTRVLRSLRECNAVFGLIRRDVLATTTRIGAFPSSDLVLLGELALRGQFHEIDEPLFLRRDHEDQSVRANPTNQDRVEWFDPQQATRSAMPAWRIWREYGRAVRESSLRGGERVRAFLGLGWWARNKYPELFGDLRRRIRGR